MKKLVEFAALLLLLTACNKEDALKRKEAVSTNKIQAVVAQRDPRTRTTLDGLEVSWQKGDVINIYNNNEFTQFSADAAGRTVTFSTGDSRLVDLEGEIYGIYPYDIQNAWENEKFVSLIPQNQYAGVLPYWDPRGMVAAGSCESETLILPFQNAHALIKVIFPLPDNIPAGFTPTSVTLDARGEDENITGLISIDPKTIDVTEHIGRDNASFVSFTNPDGLPEAIYMSVIPGKITDARVSIVGNTSDGTRTVSIRRNGTFTTERNKIYTLDFSQKAITNLGSPWRIPNGNWKAELLMVSQDGSVIFRMPTNGNSYQARLWQTPVYDSNEVAANLVTWGENDKIEFVIADNSIPTYIIRVENKVQSYGGRYFAYSQEKQASYLTNDKNDATVFTLYLLQEL